MEGEEPKTKDVRWCRQLFAHLVDGGVWMVPRSGLIFEKKGRALVLVDQMPHDSDMPVTQEELSQYQEEEFAQIKLHFAAANIEVRKEGV